MGTGRESKLILKFLNRFLYRKENLMKKILVFSLMLAILLTSCDAISAPTPAPAVVEASPIPPTAEVIVVTVEVPVEVTSQSPEVAPTPMPTATLPPAPEPTQAPPTEAPAASAPADGPMTVDSSLWGEFFKDITYSNPTFSLRCPPRDITFTVTANDPNIKAIDFYYRIEDRKGTEISEWKNIGRMEPMGNGAFSLTMSGESIHPDLRKALAWFDFQFIGVNLQGDVVGRTEKIVQLVTYTIDCQE